jgi:hypothetical protein
MKQNKKDAQNSKLARLNKGKRNQVKLWQLAFMNPSQPF